MAAPKKLTAATERRRASQKARLAELGIDLHEKPKTGRTKFHNVKAIYKGETYDSAGEAEYARTLDTLVKAGKITDWERPGPIALAGCSSCGADTRERCHDAKGRELASYHRERITYKPDFWICGAVETIDAVRVLRPIVTGWYVDYKGSRITETAAWRLKVRLWKLNIPFELRVAYPSGEEKVVCTGEQAIKERLNLR